MKKTASREPQKDVDLYLECLRGIKDLMDPDELSATTDFPPSVDHPKDEKTKSCSAFTTSNMPPNQDTEKDLAPDVPPSAASTEKESGETPDA